MERKEIDIIVDPMKLASLCTELQEKKWIAVDTEFLREKTYRPKLCLIQVATDEHLACIDPLALDNIDPFLDVMFDTKIVKVFHAASQDLEIFYWMRKDVPSPIFDTQIAAPLLGHHEQIGYSNLVKATLDITLSKAHSRSDWTRRPLPQSQLRYAADDVIYLAQLYQIMHANLTENKRIKWLDDDFKNLENPHQYEKPASDMWMKIRNSHRFKGQALSIIQKLAEWREIRVKKLNLPRNWLIKDDTIIDIAKQSPRTLKDLSHIRGLSEGTLKRYSSILLDIIEEAIKLNPAPVPPSIKKINLNATQEAVVDLLSTLSHLRSEELSIDSAVLAPRKELEKLLTNPHQSIITKGWRKVLIGNLLQELLAGKIRMQIIDQEVKLEYTKENLR